MTETPRVQYSEFIGDGQVVFRVDSVDELKAEFKQLAEASGEIETMLGVIRTARGVQKGASESKGPARRSYNRSGGGQQSSGQSKGPSNPSDIECPHGQPYSDVRGKTYQAGEKKGQPYPYELYASCGDRNCKPRNY